MTARQRAERFVAYCRYEDRRALLFGIFIGIPTCAFLLWSLWAR